MITVIAQCEGTDCIPPLRLEVAPRVGEHNRTRTHGLSLRLEYRHG